MLPAEPGRAVFLSYASQDAAAAQRICDALRAAGVEVWFDQNELVGGDAWDAKIRGQIASCALFVPVISANTQARLEGYFRLEWKLAAQRTHTMADEKVFLLPVVIDDTRDAEAKVPAEFRAVQWTRLRPMGSGAASPVGSSGAASPAEGDGKALAAFGARVHGLLTGASVPRPADGPERRPDIRSGPGRRRISRAAMMTVGLALITGLLAIWQPWKSGATAPATEAQQLVAKARAIWEEGDEVNRETYVLAEELLLKAEKLDPTEASAWALHAIISRFYRGFGFDMSTQRVEALRMQADRAAKLAPGTLDAELASIAVQSVHDQAGARQSLLELARKHPGDARVANALGMPGLGTSQDRAFLDVLERSLAASPENARRRAAIVNALYQSGRIAEAEERVAPWLSDRPNGRILWFDVNFKRWWRGDLAGAAAAIDRWPPWLFMEDRGVEGAGLLWHWKRDGERLLRMATSFPRDYVRVPAFTGPKSVLRAWALELLGRSEQAHAEWQNVVRVADRELEASPGDAIARYWKAWAWAQLGQKAEAESLLRLLEEGPGAIASLRAATGGIVGLQIQLGRFDRAFAGLEASQGDAVRGQHWITKAQLALSPIFDPLRKDPRFAELLLTAPGPEVKGDGTAAVTGSDKAAPAPSDKSLVVLPLENQSPDTENAFFTEGMHTEIIATLQRIPGLKVISRDSAAAFKGSTATLAEKAQKVGVAHGITGSVRRAGTSVRVQLELRRARDDALLWTQTYDKELGEGVIAIQSDISDQVARVLQARERRGTFAGAQFMTKHPEAYDLFLKARQTHYTERDAAGRRKAIAGLEQALALDPAFSSAARLLATALVQAYRVERNPAQRLRYAVEAKRWAETARRLLPGGAGDDALAFYFTAVETDDSRALSLAENAVTALPSDAAVVNTLAHALAEAGRSTEAVSRYRQAIALDPANPVFRGNLIGLLARLRRPDDFAVAAAEATAVLGTPAVSRQIMAMRYELDGTLPSSFEGFTDIGQLLWLQRARRDADALALLDKMLAATDLDDQARWEALIRRCDVLQGLKRLPEAAKTAEEARSWMEKLNATPEFDESQRDRRLAMTLARLGRAEEALAAGRRYVAARSAENQVRSRWDREALLAEFYAYFGRPRECVELLAKLLRVPSWLSVPMLRSDPIWDKVREDPAFQALLADPKNSAPL